MKRSLTLSLLLAACGDGDPPEILDATNAPSPDAGMRDAGTELSVESGLPNSSWFGTLTRTCTPQPADAPARSVEYLVGISDNVMRSIINDGTFEATTLDQFRYTGSGRADWLGLQLETIGSCTAQGGSFHCELAPGAPLIHKRTLRFYEGEMRWDEEIVSTEETCQNTGTLIRR